MISPVLHQTQVNADSPETLFTTEELDETVDVGSFPVELNVARSG